jgi:polyisoprenyl-teichoic acid--peptidoglycan teichoic acid transferase
MTNIEKYDIILTLNYIFYQILKIIKFIRGIMVKNKENIRSSRKSTKGIEKITRKDLERRKLLKKKAKKRARNRKIIASIIALLCIIIILPMILIGSFVTSLEKSDLMEGIEPKSNSPVNILLLGMDIGDVEQVENGDIKRTDTIMVLNYNPDTKKINFVSIPRDTQIEVQAYDGLGVLRDYWKINTAYTLGGEEEVVKHVESLLEISINYIVKIDYKAFRNFIDSIGGIKINIDQDMFYDDNDQDLYINFTAGETVLLDGQKAEEFFRWRENNDGTGLVEGDLGRIRNQQKFIKEVIKKCLSPAIIFKIPKVLDVIKEDISTNMPAKKMISYGFKFLLNDGISMNTLEGYPEDLYNESFLVVDKDQNKDIIDSLKSSTILKSSRNRSEYKILVLNGSGVNGLARSMKDTMEALGYNEVEIDNSEVQDKSTIITEDKNLKEQLKSDTGISNFEKNKINSYEVYDAVIIIGEDYNY